MLSPPLRAGISSKPSDFLPLTEYEATYVLSWHGIKGGESNHRLARRDDGVYHVETSSEPYIKILPFRYVEKTDFLWENSKIVPINYYYNFKEGRRHKTGNVFFDYKQNKVYNKISHEPWEAQLVKDLQDKLTHTIRLRLDLLKGQEPTYVYTVAEDDEIKPYTFKVIGQESLETEIGNITALKLEHTAKKDRSTLMWLSIDHHYLPVQVQHFRDGKKVGSGAIKNYRPKVKT